MEDPKKINAYILLGNMHANTKDFAKALEYYNKALEIAPNDASIHVLIANTYFMNNKAEEALKSYRYAVNLVPENDEYKLVYIQLLEDYIEILRKEEELEHA